MSDLSHIEGRKLEKLFGMSTGYVLDFSNSKFQDFITDVTGKNIYDKAYDAGSGSKANRMRKFWGVEPNYLVAKVLRQMLHLAAEQGPSMDQDFGRLWMDCEQIIKRLEASAPVPELGAISPNTAEQDFAALAKAAREAIEKNEPQSGLDRLHTFLTRYLRVICEQRGALVPAERPLHSLMGDYIKLLRAKSQLDSDMTERILKYSISTLEGFSWVRNKQSFAHPSNVLNYDESLFVYNHITALVRFIGAIERRARPKP
jgi:hypothetical protein